MGVLGGVGDLLVARAAVREYRASQSATRQSLAPATRLPAPTGYKQSAALPAILAAGTNQPVWMSQSYEARVREGYTNPYVYAAIRQISMAVAGIKWKLWKDDTKQKEADADHPLAKMWKRPNPGQGRSRFLENLAGYLLIDGNVYIERAGGTPPVELYTLRPDRVRIVPGNAKTPIIGYTYRVNSVEVGYPAEAVLHYKFFNPDNDFYGFAPMTAASKSIDQDNMSKMWNVGMLQHGSAPTGIVTTPQTVGNIEFQRIKEWVEESYTGFLNAGRPAILENGMKWQQVGLSPAEMSWLEGQKLSAREIAMVYGIAPELIGDPDSKTFSNYQEARKALYEENILPFCDWLRDDLNAWLSPLYPDNPYLDYDKDDIEALQEDRTAIYGRNDASFAAGWMRLGDAQQAAGVEVDPDYGGYYKWQLPAVAPQDPGPWRDPEVVVKEQQAAAQQQQEQQAQQQQLAAQQAQAQAQIAAASQPAQLPAAGQSTASQPDQSAGAGQAEGQAAGQASRTNLLRYTNLLPTSNKARIMTREEVKQHVDAVEASRHHWIQRYKAAYLQHLKPLAPLAADPVAIRQHLAGQRDTLLQLTRQCYHQVGNAFASQAISPLSDRADFSDFSLADPLYTNALGGMLDAYTTNEVPDRVDRIIGSLVKALPAASSLLMAVQAGTATDDQMADAPDDIDQVLDDASDVIAESEVVTASNLGPLAGATAFGVATGTSLIKCWQALHDNRTREDHLEADGQIQSLGDPFQVGDDQLMFPLDESMGAGAKQVRFCRCVVTFEPDTSGRMRLARPVWDWVEQVSYKVLKGTEKQQAQEVEQQFGLLLMEMEAHSVRVGATKDWDEGSHPRDASGRFGSGGGGESGGGSGGGAKDKLPQITAGKMSQTDAVNASARLAGLCQGDENVHKPEDLGYPKEGYADKLKSEACIGLASRLQDNSSWQAYVKSQPDLSPQEPEEKGLTTDQIAASRLVATWASTSSDTDPTAVGLQLAAQREFGLSDAATGHFDQATVDEANNAPDVTKAAYQSFVRAQYDGTQEYLQKNNITSLPLYRGVGLPEEDTTTPVDGKLHSTTVDLQPISSFAADPQTAAEFVNPEEMDAAPERPAGLAMQVPAARILSMPGKGFGCAEETEFTVLGGAKTPARMVAWPEYESGAVLVSALSTPTVEEKKAGK